MGGSSDKLNGQLKMHLDSIFDGFQKLISGSEESRERRPLPFVIEKTIHNILFIKTHMQRQDEFDAVSHFLKCHVQCAHCTKVPVCCCCCSSFSGAYFPASCVVV